MDNITLKNYYGKYILGGVLMKSFGLWYKLSNELEATKVDLHINLWNIKNAKNKRIEPFIDFGLSIEKFRNISELQILFPFSFEYDEMEDLFDKVKVDKIARTIFNDNNCDISSKGAYYYLKNSQNDDKQLFFNLKNENAFEEGIMLDEFEEDGNVLKLLKINFQKIECDPTCNEFQKIYLRFRIKTPNLKQMLFCPLNKKDWFLESGYEPSK